MRARNALRLIVLQKKPVNIYKLVTEGTVESRILEVTIQSPAASQNPDFPHRCRIRSFCLRSRLEQGFLRRSRRQLISGMPEPSSK